MLGAEIWAVSPDPADKLSSFAGKQRIGFRLLSDPELQVISSWGLINPKSPKVPHPAAVIVDPDGVIRYFRLDVDYSKRPSNDELLEALRKITSGG